MFVYLTEKDIDKIVELQNEVFNNLKKSEKAFLLPKSKSEITEHFAKGNKVIGHYYKGELVAKAIILNPSKKHPKTGMVDIPKIKETIDNISILQGVVVHPNHQGKKIGGKLIKYWVDSMASQGKTTALAESCIKNFKSYGAFLNAGLSLDSIGTDPKDGTKVFNIKGTPAKITLKKLFNSCSDNKCSINQNNECFAVSIHDTRKLKTAFNNGYIGTHWNKKKKTIQFHKRNNPYSTI